MRFWARCDIHAMTGGWSGWVGWVGGEMRCRFDVDAMSMRCRFDDSAISMRFDFDLLPRVDGSRFDEFRWASFSDDMRCRF